MEEVKQEGLDKFKEFVEDIRICMMITRDGSGTMKSRPMSAADVDDEGNVWYFTNEYSGKVDQISHENQIYITYASPSKNSYLSFPGKAELIDDRAKMKELWNPILKAWFPDGLEDPALLLIKVVPGEVEFWDGPASKIVLAWGMLKAMVTGEPHNTGEHGKISV